jgi:murein DD-endopeptidase MepM/ murein hydrolase activator NlpD
VTGARLSPLRVALLSFLLLAAIPELASGHGLTVAWQPARPRIGDVAWIMVRGAVEGASLEGSVGGRPLQFFPYGGAQAALVGFDLETKPGALVWRVAALAPGQEPVTAEGRVSVQRRDFPVQRLSLPTGMVDLDPETERRALTEGERLRSLYQTVTPERFWRGRFTRPVGGTERGSGFGARRIINGRPRSPHAGLDFSAAAGTPVVAVNDARVALIGEYFFPGRLVVLDHGLGLYTLYFHLDEIAVQDGDRVTRGQPIGTVGATGRATGPHLHFGVQLGAARIDPVSLLDLAVRD